MKNFTKMFLAACLLSVFAFSVNAQSVGINATGDAPNGSAMLDVSSTSKGLLPPRMTYAQKIAITSPAAGLMIWCTNCGTYGELQVYNGAAWTNLTGGAASGSVPGVPPIGTATAENGQASVSFTAPASNGGSAITSYTATSNPGSFTGTLSQAGSGTITVTGLTNGIAYTFTVKATNANGISVASDPSNSVTPANVPGAPIIGTATAGAGQASVPFTQPASNGGSAITSYTATSTPGSFTGTLPQAGSGTITVTGLTPGTPYTFTVAATNAIGTGAASAASNAVTPTYVCGTSLTDIRDGKVYTTVQIGTQCWMAQNMNVGTRIDGAGNQTNAGTIEKYCYNDLDANCTTYGGLYQWAETVQYLNGATNTLSWDPVPTGNVQGICPTGWHLPTDAEWYTLDLYLGGLNVNVGGAMKETATSHWTTPNLGATNSSGFTGLPGGRRENGAFHNVGIEGNFWSSQYYSYTARLRYLFYNSADMSDSDDFKAKGFSVRCIKD
jgi:uncharacterized protein (TIGR02145 family)